MSLPSKSSVSGRSSRLHPINGSTNGSSPTTALQQHSRTVRVSAKSAAYHPSHHDDVLLHLTFHRELGRGTFGCIEQAHIKDHPHPVAVKRVFQDPRYKNRELLILLSVKDHPHVVRLLYYYYTKSSSSTTAAAASSPNNNHCCDCGASSQSNTQLHHPPLLPPPPSHQHHQHPQQHHHHQFGSHLSEISISNSSAAALLGQNDIYLHLVMECFPESMADLIVRYSRQGQRIPTLSVKLFTFQMLRALGYIHSLNICHRDIKSSNLLVNEAGGLLKLCDFGSAKQIVDGQSNVAYISSRYYRAPELIFGSDHYDCSIDIWSAGCVLAELLLRKCLFMGADSVDQLAEIIKVLGTPTSSEVLAMNPKYSNYSFPVVPRCPLKIYLPLETSGEMVNLLTQMLTYRPAQRVKPFVALLHPTFHELLACATAGLSRAPFPDSLLHFLHCELTAEPQLAHLVAIDKA